MRRFRIGGRLYGIIALGGIGLIAVSIVFTARLHHMSRELKTVNGEIRQQDQARIMQLEFKKQVQMASRRPPPFESTNARREGISPSWR